jgi:3-(3-hydroxy-phenyl)propionate hydroxylase
VNQSVAVVIVGAGPTGTTAATLLAQYGISCLVLDRWDSVYPQPRAVHLDDEIHRILYQLGIAEEFAAISRPAWGLRLLDKNMNVLAEFQRNPTDSVHGYPQANMFDQPELEALLRANLKRHPGAMLRGNAEVTSIQKVGGGVVVDYTDRLTGEKRSVDATYVLGCDGANSVVRSAIGVSMSDLRFAQRWLVVDVATDAELGQWDGVHQVCSPDRAATYMRIGENRYRWEFQLRADESASDYDSIDNLLPLLSPWLTAVTADAVELVRVTEYTFRARVAKQWRDGNVFLLGDAAHLTPPFVGQGMGAGLRDAANLAWKLAGVLNGDLPAGVLDTYETERKAHARKMIALALGMGWAMTAGGRLGNVVRGVVVPRLRRIPGMRSRIVDSATPPLSKSALVVRARRRRDLAGTLCPNPILDDGERLDAVIGNGFSLITSEALDRAQEAELRKRGAAVVAVTPAGELGRWLARHKATGAIVRPDRTVMQAGRAPDLHGRVPRFLPGVEVHE